MPVQIIQYLHLRLDAAMGLGVGIAQIPCVFAVLIDNFDRSLDRVLSHRGFTRRDLLLSRYRTTVLPGEPAAGQCPAEQSQRYYNQQQLAQPGAESQPECGQHANILLVKSGVR